MFDGMKKDVRRYRDILGRNVKLFVRDSGSALQQRACQTGGYFVGGGTVATPLTGFSYAPQVYIITPGAGDDRQRGQIIAVLLPAADSLQNEPIRFVTAPEGTLLFEPDLKELLGDAEDWSKTRVYCLDEKSCGAVLYTKHAGQIYYLLIRNQSGQIGFPKGHMEYGENEIETIVREIREETGLVITPDISFREEYDYMLCGVIRKKAVYCIAEFNYYSEITLGRDEIFGKWLVTYEEARKKLIFPNDRRILQKAHQRILGIR